MRERVLPIAVNASPAKLRPLVAARVRENRALLTGTTRVIFAGDGFPGTHEGRVWVPQPHAPEGTPLRALYLPIGQNAVHPPQQRFWWPCN